MRTSEIIMSIGCVRSTSSARSPDSAVTVFSVWRKTAGAVPAAPPPQLAAYKPSSAAWKFAPALCCGNSVVLKPSELTSLTILAADAVIGLHDDGAVVLVRQYRPGDKVTVVVNRDGTELSVEATLSEGPTN